LEIVATGVSATEPTLASESEKFRQSEACTAVTTCDEFSISLACKEVNEVGVECALSDAVGDDSANC